MNSRLTLEVLEKLGDDSADSSNEFSDMSPANIKRIGYMTKVRNVIPVDALPASVNS